MLTQYTHLTRFINAIAVSFLTKQKTTRCCVRRVATHTITQQRRGPFLFGSHRPLASAIFGVKRCVEKNCFGISIVLNYLSRLVATLVKV
jgi:hypothetical protein